MKHRHPVEIPRSNSLHFEWTGDRVPCATPGVKGDSHALTWADDDGIYTGTGDPDWFPDARGNAVTVRWTPELFANREYVQRANGLAVEKFNGPPENFTLERVNDMPDFIGGGGCGCKPSGMLCVDGTLYLAVQNLLGWKPGRQSRKNQHGSDATILASRDHGKTWFPDIRGTLREFFGEQYDSASMVWKTEAHERADYKGWKPMFPGSLFGGPSFVQHGKDHRDALDGFVYAVSSDQWDNGSELRLGRVRKEKILDAGAWEFAEPGAAGEVAWRPGLELSKPVLTLDRHLGLPEMVWLPCLQKYILLTWALHEDFSARLGSELTILESDNLWGPFRLVHYEWMWYRREACFYCPKLPLKWFDPATLSGWIESSGSWQDGREYYLPQVRPFKLARM